MSPLGGSLLAAAATGAEATVQHGAGATEKLSFLAELELLGVGFAIVLGTLCALWWLTALMGWLFVRGRGNQSAMKPVATTPAAALAPPATEEDVPIAAIAAAVAVVLDAPHRILSVELQRQDWAVEGRRRIFASHQLR